MAAVRQSDIGTLGAAKVGCRRTPFLQACSVYVENKIALCSRRREALARCECLGGGARTIELHGAGHGLALQPPIET